MATNARLADRLRRRSSILRTRARNRASHRTDLSYTDRNDRDLQQAGIASSCFLRQTRIFRRQPNEGADPSGPAAEPNGIAVSAPTYFQCTGSHEFDPPETIPLKGVGDTVIYRLKPDIAG